MEAIREGHSPPRSPRESLFLTPCCCRVVCSVSVAFSFIEMSGVHSTHTFPGLSAVLRMYKASPCHRKVGSGMPVATEKDETNIGHVAGRRAFWTGVSEASVGWGSRQLVSDIRMEAESIPSMMR